MKKENKDKSCAVQLQGHVFLAVVELFDSDGWNWTVPCNLRQEHLLSYHGNKDILSLSIKIILSCLQT